MPDDSNWKMPLVRPSAKIRKRLRVVERHGVEVEIDPGVAQDPEGVVDHRHRLQSEEVHLQEAQPFDPLHVPLGDDFVLVGLVERDDLVDRHRGDHHTRGMDGRVARQPLEARTDLHDLADLRVGLHFRGQAVDRPRRVGQRFLHVGEHLGHAVDRRVGQPHHPPRRAELPSRRGFRR
jgi:hypothetical protein